MSAVDVWQQTARRPDCLMALLPYRGGCWASPMNGILAPVRPSSEPRSFAASPMEWHDAVEFGYNAIGTHDCEFVMDYTNYADYPGTIFYSNSQNGSINLYFIDGNPYSFTSFRAFSDQGLALAKTVGLPLVTAGRHTVKFRRENGTAEIRCDDVLLATQRSSAGNHPLVAGASPVSYFNGTIHSIALTDLAAGETVWRYPTLREEKNRLLTFFNVRADRGCFEAVYPGSFARLETALDLRGTVSDYTLLADCVIPSGLAANQKCEFMGQGAAHSNGRVSIMALACAGDGTVTFVTEVNGGRAWVSGDAPPGRRRLAARLRIGSGNSQISLFCDGALLAESTVSGRPRGECSQPCYALFDNRNGAFAFTNLNSPVYGALLLAESLSDMEIQALSK